MDNQIKKQIVEASKKYALANGLTQEAIADLAGVNGSYVNAMWQGNLHVKAGGKNVPIKDSYFKKLAKAVDFEYEKTYWDFVETPQYLEIHTELVDAKKKGYMKMLIGETGCGKTYTVDRFCVDMPVHTYRITVSYMHTLNDIINELCEMLNIKPSGSRVSKMKKIGNKMRQIRLDGGRPIWIFDESENLKLPHFKTLKALYDVVRDYCPIVLIGTAQLVHKLDKLREKDEEGMPQFYRRFKAGMRVMPGIDKERMFAPFLEKVSDDGLKELLTYRCDNYGELNDYLEPAMREADAFGEELTENFVCNMFGLNRN